LADIHQQFHGNFVDLLGDARHLMDGVKVASIGPATSATCRELGLGVAVESDPHDIEGLIAALCDAAGPAPGNEPRGRGPRPSDDTP
jgi:hypothetical protein